MATLTGPLPLRAVILDFNGTVSDDEPLLYRLLRDALAEEGIELTEDVYFGELAGHSDPEIVQRALELGGIEPTAELRESVLRDKIDRYKDEVRRELTVGDGAVAFVRTLAAEVPVAVCSGAVREEVELVLELAGLDEPICAVVCIDDVDQGKPDPSGYLLALARLNEERGLHESIIARDVLAVEDSVAGVAAAHAAGLRCAAIAGDERAEAAADFVIERLDAAAAKELLE